MLVRLRTYPARGTPATASAELGHVRQFSGEWARATTEPLSHATANYIRPYFVHTINLETYFLPVLVKKESYVVYQLGLIPINFPGRVE